MVKLFAVVPVTLQDGAYFVHAPLVIVTWRIGSFVNKELNGGIENLVQPRVGLVARIARGILGHVAGLVGFLQFAQSFSAHDLVKRLFSNIADVQLSMIVATTRRDIAIDIEPERITPDTGAHSIFMRVVGEKINKIEVCTIRRQAGYQVKINIL